MLSVTSLTGECEPLTNVKNAETEEEVNGGFTLSFTSFPSNNPGYDLLQEESIIELDGHEFRVINLSQKRLTKSVIGNHVYFDLIHHKVEGIQGGTRTVEEQAAFILDGSGWTWEVQGDIPAQLFLDSFGNDNAVALIKTMCETLQCERQIMPGRHIVFAKEIGKDDDFQFRYKHNIKSLSKSVDTTNLFTAVKGYGANGIAVEYRAPNWEIFAINGKPRYAEPIIDDRFTSESSLLEHVKQEFGDKHIPQMSLDVDVSEMNAQGYTGDSGLGDKIWLIYEPMRIEYQTRIMKRKRNPFIKGSLVVTLANVKPSLSDVLTETKVEIDKNKKEFRTRIEQTNESILLEAERRKGEFVESYARMEILSDEISQRVKTTTYEQGLQENLSVARSYADTKAQEANGYTDSALLTVSERLTTAESSITQLAGSITSKVEQTTYENGLLNMQAYADSVASQTLGDAKTYAETKANEARLAAEAVAVAEASLAETNAQSYADGVVTAEEQARIQDAEAKLAAAKAHAEQKAAEAETAAKQYTDGATAPLVTQITEAQSSITQLSNEINSKVSETVYLTDKQNLEGDITSLEGTTSNLSNRLYSAESSITQQAGEISSKVSYTDYNGNEMISRMNQTATTFTLNAQRINMDGIVRVNSTLRIGDENDGSTEKSLIFRSDAAVYCPAGSSELVIESMGRIRFSGYTVDFSGVRAEGLYAVFG